MFNPAILLAAIMLWIKKYFSQLKFYFCGQDQNIILVNNNKMYRMPHWKFEK